MLKFDADLLSLEIVSLKSVTTSMGGSISVIDDTRSTDKKEVLKRIAVPLSVARAFLVATKKMTRYFKPVLVAVIRYGDTVVSLERHPLSGLADTDADTTERWDPISWSNLQISVLNRVAASSRQWYFDGRYVYHLDSDSLGSAIRSAKYMSSDGKFRKVIAKTVDLQALPLLKEGALDEQERSCLAFVSANGQGAVTPPIWKNLSTVGASALKAEKRFASEDDDEDAENARDDDENTFPFDDIDNVLAVNLNFALKAGTEIGRTFGYEFVEPLQLPRLMIELHTVNLPNVPLEVKTTYDINIKFTHALAWLLGMSRKANTLETFVMMRSLMKYLSKRGVYRKNSFDASRVFADGMAVGNVPLINLADLRKEQQDVIDQPFGFSELLQRTRTGIKQRKMASAEMHQMGDMLNEED